MPYLIPLTLIYNFEILLHMVEVSHVELVQVVRVLNGDDVFPGEGLVGQKILPETGLDVQPLNSLI